MRLCVPKNVSCRFICFILLLSSYQVSEAAVPVKSKNPSVAVTQKKNLKMLHSLKDLDGTGRILEMNYKADYKLDEILKVGCPTLEGLIAFFSQHVLDAPLPAQILKGYSAGCSMFAVSDAGTGDYLMGRNYDYCHKNKKGQEVPLTAIAVHTKSATGKKSISMVDSYWLGYPKGFYTDGHTDLSMLMAAPYGMMDGMNEDGLAVGVLKLGGRTTIQQESGKKTLFLTIAMRMILDHCSTVPEAIEALKQYNISMKMTLTGSFHLFLADAQGHYSIVEYVWHPGEDVKTVNPSLMQQLPEQHAYSYVTNFYVHPSLKENKEFGGESNAGKSRYLKLKDCLEMNEYKLTKEQAMLLLGDVASSPNLKSPTSHTQWSSLYNLSKKTLDISILQEYQKRFSFKP